MSSNIYDGLLKSASKKRKDEQNHEMQTFSQRQQSCSVATNNPVSEEEKPLLTNDSVANGTNSDSNRPGPSSEAEPSTSTVFTTAGLDDVAINEPEPTAGPSRTPSTSRQPDIVSTGSAGYPNANPNESHDAVMGGTTRPLNLPGLNIFRPANVNDNDDDRFSQLAESLTCCPPRGQHQRGRRITYQTVACGAVTVMISMIAISCAVIAINSTIEKQVAVISLRPGCSDSYAILKNMDHSVDPCDDFYQFVCGEFMERTHVPKEAASVSALSDTIDSFDALINTMIHEIKPSAPKPFQLVKGFYESCMDQTGINQIGDVTLKRLISDLGGWPVVEGDEWDEIAFDWAASIYIMKVVGIHNNFFIDIGVQSDMKNNNKMIITVDQAVLGVDPRHLVSQAIPNAITNSYFDYMVDVASRLGAERHIAITELQEALRLEIFMAEEFISMDKRRNKTSVYHSYTISTLTEEKPAVNWITLFRGLSAPDAKINKNQEVIVAVPDYIDKLIMKMKATPARVVANYAVWRAIATCLPYLHEPLRKLHFGAKELQTGISGAGERWRECTRLTTTKLPLAVSSLYVQKYFPNEAKIDAQLMADNIHAEFLKILENIEWMDDTTRNEAIKKANAMAKHIGYPNELLDDKKLEKHYEWLQISRTNFFGSALNITLFDMKFKFSRLNKPVNKNDWRDHGSVTVINARHNMLENSIEIPAGILHGSMFDIDRPRYMNYAALGIIIGHEIIHGFDDEGIQFNQDGRLVQWWENATSAKFIDKTRCFIEQHDNFKMSGKKLPSTGNISQGEIIADNGGTKIAYLAYQKWAAKNPPETSLPALHYTINQYFWITAASVWCTKYKSEVYNTISPHPLAHFRVVGTLRNLEYFARDFNCRPGSGMNPKKKCQVW